MFTLKLSPYAIIILLEKDRISIEMLRKTIYLISMTMLARVPPRNINNSDTIREAKIDIEFSLINNFEDSSLALSLILFINLYK